MSIKGELTDTERLIMFAESARGEDMVAMEALRVFLLHGQSPPDWSSRHWAHAPFIVDAVLLNSEIVFDAEIGGRFIRVNKAIERYREANRGWRKNVRMIHPTMPPRTLRACDYHISRYALQSHS